MKLEYVDGISKKNKLLYILEILRNETDADHRYTTVDIMEKLESDYGITVERKSIYSDVEDLKSLGYGIVTEGRKNKTYYYDKRDFEISELKLLVDSVKAAKFISEEKTNDLIEKLKGLTSVHFGKQLSRQMFVGGKTDNENVLINVDKINGAINDNKKIRFKYWNYNLKKQKEFRHAGQVYCVSPIALIWDNEYYYLLAYSEKDEENRHYRVDKMDEIFVLDKELRVKEAVDYNISKNKNKYSSKVFGMFDGEAVRVELLCKNNMMGVLIDRVGKDFVQLKVDDEHFKAAVDVVPSKQFLGWVMGLGGGVKVIGPAPVVEDMKKEVARLAKDYDI